jgi:hypothetical protein
MAAPFKTLQRAFAAVVAGNTIAVRGGDYDTVNGALLPNGDSALPSDVRVFAYPGEKVWLKRGLNPGSTLTIKQVQDGVRAPTAEMCQWYHDHVSAEIGVTLDKCVTGAPGPTSLYEFQDGTGGTTGPVLDLTSGQKLVRNLEFDGINCDANGVNRACLASSTRADKTMILQGFRVLNAEWKNSAASMMSQPGSDEFGPDGTINLSDFYFYRVEFHHCGIPFDPFRKNINFKYLHCLYGHQGKMTCEECHIHDAAGGGWEPDGPFNQLLNSRIENNNCLGAQQGGGDQDVFRGNIFFNNGCAEIQLLSGSHQLFEHNTLVCGPANRDLGAQITFRDSDIRNNVILGCNVGILSLQPYDTANRITNNLIFGGTLSIGNGTVPPVLSGNIIGVDPMLDANYVPMAGSPVIGKATDSKNIGAK